MVRVNLQLPDWFEPFTEPAPFKSLDGGRSSGKTTQVARWLIKESIEKYIVCACIREFQNSIDVSAKPALTRAIHELGLQRYFTIKQKEIVCNVTGSRFFFQGMERNRDSIRGWEGVNRVWVEEAQRMSKATWDVLGPTVRESGAEVWFTWNPYNRTDWVWQRFRVNPQPYDVCTTVNWRDNPWFPELSRLQLEETKRLNPEMYLWMWEGHPDDSGSDRRILTFSLVYECLEGYKEGLCPDEATWVEAGLDVADTGADYNSLVARRGPLLFHAERWHANVIGDSTRHADRYARMNSINRMYFDSTGVGAGARSHFAEMTDRQYTVRPVLFGGQVTGGETMFSYNVSNEGLFARRNAQLAWALRLRAENTRRLRRGESIDPRHCLFISDAIPNTEEFMAQLTQPKWKYNLTGKIDLEKVDEKKGERSPDLFDATSMAFASDSEDGLVLRYGELHTIGDAA